MSPRTNSTRSEGGRTRAAWSISRRALLLVANEGVDFDGIEMATVTEADWVLVGDMGFAFLAGDPRHPGGHLKFLPPVAGSNSPTGQPT